MNQIYQHELTRRPGLILKNLSCSGATTASVLKGPNCGDSKTQITEAIQFLKAHPGQVAFVTIDIGGNDVDGCTNGAGLDTTCLANGLAAVNTNLPQILHKLQLAYPGIKGFGMTYYDPFLVTWLSGPSGQTLARETVTYTDTFNSALSNRYSAYGFATADVASRFQTDDFSLTGTYNSQTEPQNVANICNWTHMCDARDFHANNGGHTQIALAFEPLIDAAVSF